MSTDTLHKYAQADTPENVNVPNSWAGLITWAVSRFGVTAVLLVVIGWWGSLALNKVYADMQSMNLRMLTLQEQRATADVKLADALNNVNNTLEALRREAEAAHRK